MTMVIKYGKVNYVETSPRDTGMMGIGFEELSQNGRNIQFNEPV